MCWPPHATLKAAISRSPPTTTDDEARSAVKDTISTRPARDTSASRREPSSEKHGDCAEKGSRESESAELATSSGKSPEMDLVSPPPAGTHSSDVRAP